MTHRERIEAVVRQIENKQRSKELTQADAQVMLLLRQNELLQEIHMDLLRQQATKTVQQNEVSCSDSPFMSAPKKPFFTWRLLGFLGLGRR